ncbi:MAG TPA: AAA family ATPase, partial [Polyangiaceae bacterium]|nr:AAA family ATPase [Polyangiaceae bacterium]
MIDGALARSRDGLGALVLFTGEAGIGKSRLVREAAERAAAAGLRVAWGNCWEVGGAAPYWPWVQVFRSLERAPFDVPLPETHDFIQQRFKLFDSATRELAELARREPLVILLDDLHAADLPSLHFLSFVARQLAALPVALIGSARIPEFYAAPGVNDLLLGIMREGERVSLARLSREAVAKWVAGTADSEAVYAATEGNPLFVKEVLRLGAVARGPNDTIAKVLDAHLRLLPADAHGLLAMASVFGRQISVQELAALAGTSSDALREHLNTACSLGVLEPLDGSRLQFTHVLLRERLYEALRERSALEWKAGLLLETRGADPALVAHHLLAGVDAGDVARAGRAALRAIEHAQTTLAFEFAAAFAEEVLARLGTSLPAPLACELEVAFGEALMRAGSFSGGRAQCVRAAERARSLGHAEMQARAALAYGSEMLAASVDPVMVRLLEDAKSALGTGDSALGARVGARLAAALIPPATPEEAKRVQALSHAALATARRIGDRSALLWTLLFVRAALIALIHDDEVFALTEELVDLARSLEQRDVLMIVGPKHAVALLERGRRAEARAALAELVETAAEVRYPLLAWRVPMLRAAFAMFDGRLDEARELGEEALALAQKAGTQQANVVWAQQRIAIAIARREPASIAPDADRVLSMLRTNPLLSPIRAWVLAACGSPREALQELESLSERDQAFGLVFAAETCLLLESCPRDGEAMPDSLAALAARVRPLLSERWHGTRFFFGALAAGFVVGP